MAAYAQELALAVDLARKAGAIALKHRRPGVAFEEKPGELGPVTAADKEADAMIRQALGAAFPTHGLLTEETPDDGAWRHATHVWMVDPLDGTKEFIKGTGEFAAMLGLSVDGVPVVGAVYQPVGDMLYAASLGGGAWIETGGVRTALKVPEGIPSPLTVAVSRSHRSSRMEAFLANLGPIAEFPSGSVGLKIGLIAQGVASAYLNPTAHTCLWDTCGPAAILAEAGGVMADLFGNPLSWTGSIQHQQGLFCATAAAHKAVRSKIQETANAMCDALEVLPAYPSGAFRRPGR